MKNKLLYIIPFTFLTLVSCREDQDNEPNNGNPFISELIPASGRTGNRINITGGNFSKSPKENRVFFNGIEAEVYVGIDEEMIVTVPKGATTGPVTIVVPGYDTAQGPVFTIEQFLKPVLYWHNVLSLGDLGSGIIKTTFDDEGTATVNKILSLSKFFTDSLSTSIYAFEYDAALKAFYLPVSFQSSSPPMPGILKINPGTGTEEILYGKNDPLLQELVYPIGFNLDRIVLDYESGSLYVTDSRGKILKGAMDGSRPLEVVYDNSSKRGEKPYGIALAAGQHYLYWAETDVYNSTWYSKVFRTSISSRTTEVLYDSLAGLKRPKDIVIDETRNRLYVTDDPNLENGINVDCIWQGSLDGSMPLKKIFSGDGQVSGPVGMALDVENNQLYWKLTVRDQAQTNQIVRADLDDENPRIDVLLSGKPVDGFSIGYFTLSFEEEETENSGGRLAAGGMPHSNGHSRGRVQ